MNTLSPSPATLKWPAGVQWVKADVGETGFYRVNYEADNWRALTQHLMENPDSTVSGLGLVSVACV